MGTLTELKPGSHIKVSRFFYEHHGIFIGNNKVIHYDGGPLKLSDACIRETSLKKFADGNEVETVHESTRPDEVIKRARTYLGECKYNLFFNNCEHFANFCVTGEKESPQVIEKILKIAVAALLTIARRL